VIKLFPEQIFYEPSALEYTLGMELKKKYKELPWVPIENHNAIEELRKNPTRNLSG